MTAAIQRPAALAIVVPTYNECDRLTDLVDRIFSTYAAAGIDGEIVIVDDNSPDGTGALADRLARGIASPCCTGLASWASAPPSLKDLLRPALRSWASSTPI